MRISDEVYNCLINQAIVMKHGSNQSSEEIARKVVNEYLAGDETSSHEMDEIISRINNILKD